MSSFIGTSRSVDGKCIYLSIYLFNNFDKQIHRILHAEINIHESM